MNIFKRLLKIGQAEIHALVDKMEDPIHLTEQGIKDMKKQLRETEEGYIQSRAQVIRNENLIQSKKIEAQDYEDKARIALEKIPKQELDMEQAEHLAMEALRRKKDILDDLKLLNAETEKHAHTAKEIAASIDILTRNISKWEKELTTLKAKEKVNSAAEFANKQMANIASNSTIEMLEKLKAKAASDDAMGEAYREVALTQRLADTDPINSEARNQNTKQELEQLKKQLGLKP
ncbi:PspA/IM30 family protein [Sphingobacterium sp. Mn56C]|uniref:PspA/IM30 family protein n=1 Tax=Sphingobacterium sp. Mn56C TaxID=3395261 RepID=UPI003BECFBA6